MPRTAFILIVLSSTVAQVRAQVAGQAPDFTLKRFGRVPVSDAEVAQIAGLASSTGKRLWLLRTPNPVMTGERVSYLLLEPDVFGKRVLRGRVLRLRANEPPNVPIRSPWKISESYSYACGHGSWRCACAPTSRAVSLRPISLDDWNRNRPRECPLQRRYRLSLPQNQSQ
jgi:hypothetical protein